MPRGLGALRHLLGLHRVLMERGVPGAQVDHATQDPLEVAEVQRPGHLHARQPHHHIPAAEMFRAEQSDLRGERGVVALDLRGVLRIHAARLDHAGSIEGAGWSRPAAVHPATRSSLVTTRPKARRMLLSVASCGSFAYVADRSSTTMMW